MAAALTDSEALEVLARQQRRREAGTPVLGVLVGLTGHALGVWGRWARAHAAPGVTLAAGPLATQWLEQASVAPGLHAALLRALALPHEGWAERTRDERARWLTAAAERPETPELPVALLYFLQEGQPLACAGAEARAVVAALTALLPTPACPPLLVVPGVSGEAAALLEEAARLCWAAPRLPLGLALPPDTLQALLSRPESRPLAMLREGRVELPPPGAPLPAVLPSAAPAPPASSLQRLTRDGASEALLTAFAQAACAPLERARSLAEAFLFERLESLPATRGLFVLNGTLPFRFGPRAAEVDLLCAPLRLALEVDGWHHFRDEDAWRRDRRKDLLLQQHGYQVLRVLAGDVVAHLGDVLDTVLAAVAHRRHARDAARRAGGTRSHGGG